MRKPRILFALILLLTIFVLPDRAEAADPCAIYLDGKAMSAGYSSAIRSGTSYLPLRAVADHYGGKLTWDAKTRTARWSISGLEVTARAGDCYIEANGRALYAGQGIFIQNGRMMVPTRLVAQSLGGSAEWNGQRRSVHISTGSSRIRSGSSTYDSDALYWLSRIISAESRGEPIEGQIAVGNVVLNRVKNVDYPNTIYGVIFDRNYGVQFEPVINGSIYAEPTASAVIAAKLCLEGVDLSRGSIYFYDPAKAQSSWIGQNCTYIMTIGTHKFYI